MATASPDISVIIIEELPIPGFGGTRLELRGGGLPKQGATWDGKHRVITKYYVGNPVATQQALGPTEQPSSWEGTWHRNMLEESPAKWTDEDDNTSQITQPHVLMQILDGIRFRGYGLRVTWSTSTQSVADDSSGTTSPEDVTIIREGRLTDVSFPVTRASDIDWKATFDWKSRGQPAPPVSLANDAVSGTIAVQLALTANLVEVAALKNALNPNAIGSVSDFSLDQLFKFATYPQSIMDSLTGQINVVLSRIQDLADLTNQSILTPAQVADQALSVATSALAIIQQASVDLSQIPIEYNTVADGSAADVARNAQYLLGVQDALNTSQQELLILQQQALKAKASQSPVDDSGAIVGDAGDVVQNTLYKVKDGDTALSISLFYYGSSDYAGSILKANRLSPYTVDLDIGSILVIPTNPQAI